jgi:hypothetical protein
LSDRQIFCVCALLEQGSMRTLLNEATEEQLLRAGNVGGELLDWIAMLGTIGERRPKFVTPQMDQVMPMRRGA